MQQSFSFWSCFLLCSRLYSQIQYIAIALSKDNQNTLVIVSQGFSLSQETGQNWKEYSSLVGHPGTLIKLQLQICVVLKEATPVAEISISAHQQCLYWLESTAQVVINALSSESGSTTVGAGEQDGLCGICELLVLLTISPAHLVSGGADKDVKVAF